MDKTRIIQQGEEAKFRIEIENFDIESGTLQVELIHGYRRQKITITKEQIFQGSDGNWYFTFSTEGITGRVTAVCTWRVPDTDCDDGYREEVDEQYLCFVVSTPCPQFVSCPNCDATEQRVTYTRTEQSSIADDYAYLGCADYDRIISVDDEIMLVLKEIENNNNE